MNKTLWALFITVLFVSAPAFARYTGTMPVPVFTDAGVQVVVGYDAVEGLYTYTYTITNPSSNTGEIWRFDIDIITPRYGMELSSSGLIVQYGASKLTFDEIILFKGDPEPMVPVGIRVPVELERAGQIGWGGSISNRGFAGFYGRPKILPGESLGGFEFYSRGLPGIRDIEIQPHWVMMLEGSAREEDAVTAREIDKELTVTKKTIGPTAPPYRKTNTLFDTIGGYINESVSLGWLTDAALADALRAKLAAAIQFMDANDGTQVKAKLVEFMTLLANSTASQRTNEGYGLLYYNAKYLHDRLADTVIPPKTLMELGPAKATLPMGTYHTLTATLTVDGRPMPGEYLRLYVISGPNKGEYPDFAFTDDNGQAVFSFTSDEQGTDRITAEVLGEIGMGPRQGIQVASLLSGGEETKIVPAFGMSLERYTLMAQLRTGDAISEPVEVTWKGGPDLMIDIFIPPVINAKGGDQIDLKEVTVNVGNAPAGESPTLYFLSDDETIDPYDIYIGSTWHPPLDPGMSSDSGRLTFTLPYWVEEGSYFMGACADGWEEIPETDEENNCRVNTLVLLLEGNPNQPPDCTQAGPTISSIWPANHKLVDVGVFGVTDPDGDEVTLTVTGITQDEPVNGLGDGDMSPDGFGIGFDKAELRAERSGTGNGRVYAVSFSADDGNGGICTGSVNVRVPRDRKKRSAAVDDGQNYNSMLP